MLPKVAHYAGFQSYSTLPYPSLKPGKESLDSNKIWSSTKRVDDELKPLNNFDRLRTTYHDKINENVQPEHFQTAKYFKKGTGWKTANAFFAASSGRQAPPEENLNESQAVEAGRASSQAPMSRTGVEHWKTSYQFAIKDPYAYTRASRPEWSNHTDPHKTEVNDFGRTEYQFHVADKTEPEKLEVERRPDDIRSGTTQNTNHVPGYRGHLPASKANKYRTRHGSEVRDRTTIIKNNVVEN
eukprot:TRINITY_DN4315_c0_g1_i4.p1 TRINITY_DN4315_c0_g1~~TRINITY_DN4315_c0_g1_i4.p1  ORF type:complete len:241 (-),score=55.06 TRINITY_DN4315_c0_g1_i4:250-972(-)